MYLVRNSFLLLILLVIASCAKKQDEGNLQMNDSKKELPIIKDVGTFSGTTSENKPFSNENLKGIPSIVYFMFTTCKGPCPIINKQTETLLRELKTNVQFVAITVDPEKDTPEQLLEYSKTFSLNKNSWFFVQTIPDSLRSIAVNNFMVGDMESPMVHSTRYILVDKNSKIRGYYDGLDSKAIEQMKKDLLTL
jgi:protein SCO1/2